MERLDKNVMKNIAIIFLVIFLGFSIVVNIVFLTRNQSLNQQDTNSLFIGKFHFNQSQTEFSFKPFNGTTFSVQNYSAIVHSGSGFYPAGIQSGD